MAKITVTTSGTTVVVKNGDSVTVDIPGGGWVNIVADPTSNIKNVKIDFGGDDTVADEVRIDLSTFRSYDLHIDINDYDPTDSVVLNSAFNRHVDAGNEDEYNFQYIGSNGATFNGFLRAKDKGERDFTTKPPPIVVCFAEGTVIDTELGPTPVECLAIGNTVRTRDSGDQPIRWIGRRHLDSLDLARDPNLAPVVIRAGALGQGLPFIDLTLSPQHRILVTGWRAELHFGEAEVLAPAVSFVNGTTVAVVSDAPTVTYFHLLFERHEIVNANGVASESLHTGEMAAAGLAGPAAEELRQIFPDIPFRSQTTLTARPVAKRRDSAVLRVA